MLSGGAWTDWNVKANVSPCMCTRTLRRQETEIGLSRGLRLVSCSANIRLNGFLLVPHPPLLTWFSKFPQPFLHSVPDTSIKCLATISPDAPIPQTISSIHSISPFRVKKKKTEEETPNSSWVPGSVPTAGAHAMHKVSSCPLEACNLVRGKREV